MDSNDQFYSHVQMLIEPFASPSDCAQLCSQLPSPHLVGFWLRVASLTCQCFYSGKNIPTPPSGLKWVHISGEPTGTGAIGGAQSNYPGECFAFPQVREIFYFHPQVSWSFNVSNVVVQGTGNPTTSSPSASPSIASPSAAPSPAALSYYLFDLGSVCSYTESYCYFKDHLVNTDTLLLSSSFI